MNYQVKIVPIFYSLCTIWAYLISIILGSLMLSQWSLLQTCLALSSPLYFLIPRKSCPLHPVFPHAPGGLRKQRVERVRQV